MKNLIILGAGGFGKTIADIAEQCKAYKEIYFLDDSSDKNYVLGKCDRFITYDRKGNDVFPAFGDNELRLAWVNKLLQTGYNVPSFIHKSAYVSKTVKIGCGNAVLPNAVINTDCILGNACIINCGAIIDHDCVICDGVHICLGAIVKANNNITKCKKLEAGCVVDNGFYK